MQAQQQGTCSRCLTDFPKGTEIVPHDGGWMHRACASGQDDADQPAPVKKATKKAAAPVEPPTVEPASEEPQVMVIPDIPADGLLIRDLHEPTYHAHPTSLSVSGAKLLRLAPALFRHQQDHPVIKDEFDYGSAAHKYVLGTGPEIVDLVATMADGTQKVATDRRSPSVAEHAKAIRGAGKLPMMAKAHSEVKAMAAQLLEHPLAARLLNAGEGEVSVFHHDPHTGLEIRGRCDWLRKKAIIDYKTAVDVAPHKLKKISYDHGWYMQAAWYVDLLNAVGYDIADTRFYFVVQMKTPPYLVDVVVLDARAMALGRQHNREALERWRDCLDTDLWPGYGNPNHHRTITLPEYAYRTNQDD